MVQIITLTCFGGNTPSSGSLQVVLQLQMIKMIKYKTVVCYDKILVNVAAYVIPC